MISDETKLNSIISMYEILQNKIEFRQKRADEAPILGTTLLLAALGTQFIGNLFNVTFLNPVIIIICFIVPLIIRIGLERAMQEHKFLAVLRGHSSFLEEKINALVGDNIILWNSKYIDKYIASQTVVKKGKLKDSHVSTYITGLVPTLICLFAIIYNISDTWLRYKKEENINLLYLAITVSVLAIILFPIYFIDVIKLCKKITGNENIRTTSKNYPKTLPKPNSKYK